MEVEVKLRLPNAAAHQKLSDVLSPYHTKTHLQQNLFFDTPSLSLATTHLAALRLRFYDLDSQAILSLKSRPTISAGISRIEEDEEPLDPSLARLCAAEPWRFSTVEKSRILKRVKEEFGVDFGEIVCLGGFRNVRSVHDWNGLKLELDETEYDFGVNYELECESNRPDEAKLMIEDLLNRNGIRFSYSQVSKFAIFRSGKLPEIKQAIVRTSWTTTNPGRRFYSCPDRGSNCTFIGWVDPAMCARSKDVIPGLLNSKNRLEERIKEKDATIWKLKIYLLCTWVLIIGYCIY